MPEKKKSQNKTLFNPILLLMILLIGLLIVIIYFISYNYNSSIDGAKRNYRSSNISSPVSIVINNTGFPHIQADNERDMLFAMGFIHAKDRLWQMEINRRLIAGELSEILGSDYVLIDKFMRSMAIYDATDDIYNNLTTKEKDILTNYTNGINDYIEKNKKYLPFEFGLLDISPEQWEAKDCIAIQRLFALRNSVGFWFEPVLSSIANKIGKQKALDLLPNYSENMPYQFEPKQNIVYKEFVPEIDSTLIDSTLIDTTSEDLSYYANEVNSFNNIIKEVKDILHVNPSIEGCNLWVIKKDLNDPNSDVILANDLHSAITLPTPWYFMHYTSPNINVTGITIPGFPFAISGRNNDIAWGMTALRADDSDYYIMELDSTGEYYFDDKDSMRLIELQRDTIRIKNMQEHIYFKKKIENQYILSGQIFDKYIINKKTIQSEILKKYAFLNKWMGFSSTHELSALYNISRAKDTLSFNIAVEKWSVPGVVFGFADVNGNFGLKSSAILEYKLDTISYAFPLSIDEYSKKRENFLLDYQIYNDSNQFVVSANNKLTIDPFGLDTNTRYISNYWANWSRAIRISNVLINSDKFDITDAKILQTDIYSAYAEELLDICIPVWRENEHLLNPKQKEAFEELESWNYIFSNSSYRASIFVTFLYQILYNTFADELGDNLFNQYMEYPDFAYGKLYELLTKQPSSAWFDDIKTNDIQENAYYLVFISLADAVDELTENFGTSDMFNWRYSIFNNSEISILLNENKIFNAVYETEKLATTGHQTTINNLVNYRNYSYGASARIIMDLSEDKMYYSMSGGQSGNPISDKFSDLLGFWNNNAYYSISTSKIQDKTDKEIIVIKPK